MEGYVRLKKEENMEDNRFFRGYLRLSLVVSILLALVAIFHTTEIGWGLLTFFISVCISLMVYCGIIISLALFFWVKDGFKERKEVQGE